jgi:hypothetical protein
MQIEYHNNMPLSRLDKVILTCYSKIVLEGFMRMFLVGSGVWLLSDAIYSYALYYDKVGPDNVKRQNWKRDHWVRLVRAILAIGIIIVGCISGI